MATAPKLHSLPHPLLLNLASPIDQTLSATPYSLPPGASVSTKSLLQSLLPSPNTDPVHQIRDFFLCCAALASAHFPPSDSPAVYWIPKPLSDAAMAAVRDLSVASGYGAEIEMVVDMMPEVLPVLKGVIRESCVDPDEEEFTAAAGRKPVGEAVLAAHQFRWIVMQVGYPHLGKVCQLVIPCALTAMDHWSPELKEQGMISFMHLVKNVTAAELGWYEDAILDACQRNIASNDELWHHVIELSVLLLTCTQQRNPRSYWFERLLNEMLGHLERQPTNKERRIAWLELIEPVLDAMGLFILAHFRRLFYLLFQWMHADDDKTILLVLERLHTIIKLTWIRKSPYIERLIEELTLLFKEAALRKNREVIRGEVLRLMILLRECKAVQFEAVWDKHKNDPDLTMLASSAFNQSDEAKKLECIC